MFNPAESDINSFITTSRAQRVRSMTNSSPRATSYYPPFPSQPTIFDSQSDNNFNTAQPLRALSPDDLQKMKYKIELDKQVAEKKQRRAHEWETKIERDRKYVQHQPFGRHDQTTLINKQELQEILSKGRAPSPILDMPQQLPLNYPLSHISNGNNSYGSFQQPTYNNYPQPTNYSTSQTKPQSPQKNDSNQNNMNPDFQHFYGPIRNGNVPTNQVTSSGTTRQVTSSGSTTQPIKGDAHDPFISFDPNKEGQNVFNIIPQQDLYDPWGRPGGGAPLVHQPTGQKFTRYSGSLQDKLNTKGPLGFYQRQYSGNIEEQKRDLELEQKRRQQEELEHRSNAGDTADWISQLESSRYPLKLHLPTTETTREYIGARGRYGSQESRSLHDHLVQQAEERARLQQINRYRNSIAELQHTEAQNSWWGRSGGGAPSFTNRRHNVENTFENPRQKWTTNHLGQLVMADGDTSNQVKLYDGNYLFPKTSRYSNHRNYYEVPNDQQS